MCNALPPFAFSYHKMSVVFAVAERLASSLLQLVDGLVDKICAGLKVVVAEILKGISPGIPPNSTTKPLA